MLSLEYVAGLFDGEGCVYISPNLVGIQVSVTQQKTEILYLLKKQFGGGVTRYGKQSCHKWRLTKTEDIEIFLNAIYPYCIVKKAEVAIGLLFVGDKEKESKKHNPLRSEQLQLRGNLHSELKLLRNGHTVT